MHLPPLAGTVTPGIQSFGELELELSRLFEAAQIRRKTVRTRARSRNRGLETIEVDLFWYFIIETQLIVSA